MYKYLKIIHLDALKSVFEPLFFVLAFGLGLGRNVDMGGGVTYLEFMAPGVVFMVAANSSYMITSFGLFHAKEADKIMNAVLVAPIKPFEIVLGYILTGTAQAAISAGVFMLILHFIFGLDFGSTILFMVFIIITAAFFACLGVILCMSVTDVHSLVILTSLIIYPLSFLCGIFFPVEYLPSGIQPIIELIPLTRAVEGIRTIPFTIYNPSIWLNISYIAVSSIIFFVIGTYIFKKRILI